MNCDHKYISYMYKWIDETIEPLEKIELLQHVKACSRCQKKFEEIKSVDHLLDIHRTLKAPNGFTSKVLDRLPKEKTSTKANRWFKSHPLLTAAVVFLLLMSSAIFSEWGSHTNEPISVSANGAQVRIDEELGKVIVPEGEVVKGDLVVHNGDVEIAGKVQGDVTVINGSHYLASAGHIAGDSEEIHRVTEWVWYKVKEGFEAMKGWFVSN
ncbi:polymer-forming cytoskeletal protein [Alkalihalobacillus sp. AL-G]|uniref:polymer-forming cytoskeletal protein n=1 Tax=Alkalihalobacillus sp. AL-G TaxID=2926399 RepID=UPI002729A621|nr:polymer-forming cytoskeletal protein [Alkalihalobacillus sp. AL-G]WLD93573.1 polymer-forming cytoskeletal protein [Alkalihalobacillus sp. AL-G]